MRRHVVFPAIAACVALGVVLAEPMVARPKADPNKAISTVLLDKDAGHGSGVHIGRGFIVTAAHVVADDVEVTVVDSNGASRKGVILWANREYDVALVRVDDYATIEESRMDCDGHLVVGANVRAVGNPLEIRFVHTWGRISASAMERAPFKQAYIVDVTVAPGMSGGPVFDESGGVVGIVNAVAVFNSGFSPTLLPLTYIVPSFAICGLMAQ